MDLRYLGLDMKIYVFRYLFKISCLIFYFLVESYFLFLMKHEIFVKFSMHTYKNL